MKYCKAITDIPRIEHEVGILLSKWDVLLEGIMLSTGLVFELDWKELGYGHAHTCYSVAIRKIKQRKLPLSIVVRKNRLFLVKRIELEQIEET